MFFVVEVVVGGGEGVRGGRGTEMEYEWKKTNIEISSTYTLSLTLTHHTLIAESYSIKHSASFYHNVIMIIIIIVTALSYL